MTALATSPELKDSPEAAPAGATPAVDPDAFVDPARPQSWSRQMAALLEAGHYREAYELLSQKVPYIENQLRYFAQALAGQENQWSIVHDRLGRLLDSGRPQRILDIGCSIGCHAIAFAREGHQTWGIDILSGMIARGREIIESLRLAPRAHLVEGDIRRLEGYFESRSFDAAVAGDIFEHLDDESLLAVLGGLRKVLRPGARLAFHTSPGRYYYWFEPDRRKLLALLVPLAWLPDRLFSSYVRGLDRLLVRRIRREPAAFYRHEHGHINCMDPDHLRCLLAKAGLENIRTLAVHAHPGFKDEGCLSRRWLRLLFGGKSVACRNVFGVATVPEEAEGRS